jgi:hypothetical protein
LNKVKKLTALLEKNYDSVYVIHYAGELRKDKAGLAYSSRITSVAILHAASRTMHSFSLHLVAEIMGVAWEDLDKRMDDVEARMLSDLFAFIKNHSDALWIHWEMSNIHYGFQALAHRYTILTGEEAPPIADKNRINLSSLVAERYGKGCVDHPILYNLIRLNNSNQKGMLTGAEEVEAFENRELKKLHNSNMSKVYSLNVILDAVLQGKLQVQHSAFPQRVSGKSGSEHSIL